MSRVLPILFNTEMVQAILDGRKTVTRRLIRPQPTYSPNDGFSWKGGAYGTDFLQTIKGAAYNFRCAAPYQPGDILYVRETWRVGAWDIRNQMIAFDYKDGTLGKLTYIQDRELFDRLVNQSREDARKAGCEYNGSDFVWEKGKSPCRWRPSIHMPKEAARIFLKVKDVRIERLQDITEEQIRKEGVVIPHDCVSKIDYTTELYFLFQRLWDSTIKKSDLAIYGWDANPWVWVIEFERCEKPEGENEM